MIADVHETANGESNAHLIGIPRASADMFRSSVLRRPATGLTNLDPLRHRHVLVQPGEEEEQPQPPPDGE